MSDLKSFQVLSFDCYGTLVDWEGGIIAALKPLTVHLSDDEAIKYDAYALLSRYKHHESHIEEQFPTLSYPSILERVYVQLAKDMNLEKHVTDQDRIAFGASIGTWPAFPDTVTSLNKLSKHYKLVILSNVNRESFARTLAGPLAGVRFDAVYVAEDIGSYKPDLNNFEYLVRNCEEELGVPRDRILHTAYALFHDLTPAKKCGLHTCWIERKPNAMGGEVAALEEGISLDFSFATLKDMVDALK